MHWSKNNPYEYHCYPWTIVATDIDGYLVWYIYRDGNVVGQRENLKQAKEYCKRREVKNG